MGDRIGRRGAATALVTVGALVPRLLSAGKSMTSDEGLWLERTVRFGDAIVAGDLARASASVDKVATMPGVTTMWIGNLARGFHRLGKLVGLVGGDADFGTDHSGFVAAQMTMGVVTALLVGLIVWLAWDWIGAVPALAAGVVLATEPIMVGNGILLHTDALLMLFGTIAVIAFARLFGWGGDPPDRPVIWAVLAGGSSSLALLTKISAGILVPSLGLLTAIAIVGDVRRTIGDGRRWYHAPTIRHAAIILGVGVAFVLALWPAIWADGSTQYDLVREAAGLAGRGHRQLFRGEVTRDPGPWFYLVGTPYVLTPWFLLSILLFTPLAFVDRTRRRQVLVLGLTFGIGLMVLSTGSKKFLRYSLPILPQLAMLVGIGLDRSTAWVRTRFPTVPPRLPSGVGIGLVAITFVNAVAVSPWHLVYVNPVLLTPERAERTILIGRGEGIDLAARKIVELENGDCEHATVSGVRKRMLISEPCVSTPPKGERARYRIEYINARQRSGAKTSGTLVGTVHARGFDLVRIYRNDDHPDPGS